MPITTKNILFTTTTAIAWVLLVMLATFTNEFKSWQFGVCNLETIGAIILTMIIYVFDILLMEIILLPSTWRTWRAIRGFYVLCLMFVMINLLILFLAAHFFAVSSIYPILFLGISMGSIKAVCIFRGCNLNVI